MEASLKFKVSEIFTRYNFSKEDAHFISDVLSEIDERQNHKFEAAKDFLLSQKDKVELMGKIADIEISLTERIADVETRLTEKIADVETRLTERIADVEMRLTEKIKSINTSLNKTIYIVGLVQFSAIIASVLAIVNFILKTR